MTLRADELARACAEVGAALVGLPVHKVTQPDAETVLLVLRGRSLVLCASARAGRLHLLPERPAGRGEAPPAFCMLLRKHLVGARLVAVRAVEGERACELELASADDAPILRLFLFGPAAQLQLVARGDDGARRVLGAIGPARRLYDALPAPHPRAASTQATRFADEGAGISSAIAACYDALEGAAATDAARRRVAQRLDAALRQKARLADALLGDLRRAEGADALRQKGDLLLAHLPELKKGMRSVTLPDDFGDGAPVEIALDPARAPRHNAERLYKEAKRLGRARATIAGRLDAVRAELARLEAERAALAALPAAALLAEERPAARGRAAAKDARALPYKRYVSARGTPIYVGRGAKKNDELTWKIARGSDLWLHARDVPGAHVVVPLDGRNAVDPETLIDAATLAAHHSSARGEAQVDIGYALRKHLRKPRGGPPGAVLVAHEKTVRVRMEPERLARLLEGGG